MAANKLELKERVFRSHGDGRYDRFIDFVIDGKSVREHKEIDPEYISPLIIGTDSNTQQYLSRLLGDTEADLPGGRYTLYVCPECQDISCGIVSMEIAFGPEGVRWKNFGWQSDLSEVDLFEHQPGPYDFNREDYARALTSLKHPS
jgi:hypothetical protein